MAFEPNFVPTPNGLFVPATYMEGIVKAREEAQAKERGKFFSEYATYGLSDQKGMPSKPWTTPSFQFLRQCARDSIIDRALIDLRKTQIVRVARPCYVPGKQVGYRVVHKRYADPTFEMTESIRQRCEDMMRRLERLTPEVHPNIRNFFSIAVEEELSIDRKCMVIFRDRRGKPTQYHLIDGATIKPRLQALAPFMLENKLWDTEEAAARWSYQARKKGQDIDLTGKAWVQEINGRIYAAWKEDEMSVDVTAESIELDKLFYGRSVLERSLRLLNVSANIWRYNQELFRTNVPEGVLLLFGDFDPKGMEAFKKQMLAETSVGGNWRYPMINAGPKEGGIDAQYVKMRDTPRDAMFTELLQLTICLQCAEYRAHPSVLNMNASGGTNSMIFSSDEEIKISMAQEEGFHGLLDSMAGWITQALIEPTDPELMLIWEGLERDPDAERIDNRLKQMRYMKLNEVRALENLPPMPSDLPTSPGEMIMDQQYFAALQAVNMSQMQAQGLDPETGQPTQPEGAPGQPGQGEQEPEQPALPPPVRG